MKNHSFLTDLIQFKDEIFKTIRLLENRLTSDITDKFTQSSLLYEAVNNRLNLISSNNDSLLELLTSQKLNLDKISSLEKTNNKIEQNLITNELKLKQIISEIENLRDKYEKIMFENLQVTGYVGPGCQYKNIGDYIRTNIAEFSKMKMDKEKIKMENSRLKNKLDNMVKNTLSLVDSGIITCQKYSDRKHADIKTLLENKLIEFNEKNMDLRAMINKAETDNEKNVENLRKDVEELQSIKEAFINATENKISEINDKIEIIIQEIEVLKKINKGNKKINDGSNMNRIRGDDRKGNVILNKEEEIKGLENNINKKKEKIDYYMNNTNTNRTVNERSNISSRKEKEKENNLSENYTMRSTERINQDNGKYKEEKKEEKFLVKKNNLFEEVFLERKKNENMKDKDNINNNNIDNNKKEYSENKAKEKKEEKEVYSDINDINANTNDNFIEEDQSIVNTLTVDKKIDEQKNIYQKGKLIFSSKIKIESQEKKDKQKISFSNGSGSGIISISNLIPKKEETDPELIKSNIFNESNSKENFYSYNNILLLNKEKEKEKYGFLPIFQKFQNKDIISKMKRRTRNLISPKKSSSFITKKEKKQKKEYIMNEEQKQVMDVIKTYYNNMKERQEQKSLENLVDCNVVNLRLDKNNNNKKRRHKNTSAKVYKNSLSEISMKLSPAFGRTAYNFFIKNKIGESDDSGKHVFNNVNSLKTGLNAAYITSIKNKINFNDKANIFS